MSGKIIAVVPARGGSKRLPRKNVMPFRGRPMLAHTVAAARESGQFDRIVVSTDDPQIARVAISEGAEAPFLRERHADDHAPVSLATIDAVERAAAHFGESYETVVQLMANCPLRDAADIRAALDRFAGNNAAFQVSAFRYSWMNPWWAATLDELGRPTPLFPDVETKRSQDLPPLYCPSGAIWIARWEALRASGTFYGPGHVYFVMGWESAVDIDDADDLAFAEAIDMRRAALAGSAT